MLPHEGGELPAELSGLSPAVDEQLGLTRELGLRGRAEGTHGQQATLAVLTSLVLARLFRACISSVHPTEPPIQPSSSAHMIDSKGVTHTVERLEEERVAAALQA